MKGLGWGGVCYVSLSRPVQLGRRWRHWRGGRHLLSDITDPFPRFRRVQVGVGVGRGGRRRRRRGGRRFGEDGRLFAVEKFRAKFGHFILHFAHFGVEALADRVELGIQNGKVAQFHRDNVLLVGHYFLLIWILEGNPLTTADKRINELDRCG